MNRASTTSRPSSGLSPELHAEAFGLFIALWLLSGRWSPSRIFALEDALWIQPRVWVVGALVLLSALPSGRRAEAPRASSAAPLLMLAQGAFLTWTLVSLAWSPGFEFGSAKAIEVGLLFTATLTVFRAIRTCDAQLLAVAFWRWVIVITCGLGFLALVGALGGGRVAVLGGGPNIFGRNMGLLAITSLSIALRRERPGRWVVLAIIAAALCVLSGSRGAMIATSFALCVVLIAKRERIGRSLLVLIIVSLVGFALLLWTDLGSQTVATFRLRIIDLLIEQRYGAGREMIYPRAIALWKRYPIAGGGLGAFGVENYWRYPHNMFLEAACEGGAVGVLLMFGFIGTWALSLLPRGRGALDEAAAAAALFIVASQFSGDIFDTRGAYVFTLFSAAYSGLIVADRKRRHS